MTSHYRVTHLKVLQSQLTLFNLQMFWTLILVTIVLLAAWIYYAQVLKPKKLQAFYYKVFSPYYKVYQYPFIPCMASEFVTVFKNQEKDKDCFKHYREVGSQFDLVISNVGHKVQLNLVSPQLMQAFHELDTEKYYHKYELLLEGLRRMVGNGITFASGQLWKMKRRVTSKMLNFNYISTLVPKMEFITKRQLEKIIQKGAKNQEGFYQFDALQLTTDIASTVILQLFFGGIDMDVSELKVRDSSINQHMRRAMMLLQKQIFNPLVIMFGQKYARLGISQLDRQVNTVLHDFNHFTNMYVVKRLDALVELYKDPTKKHPQIYTDLIEAFFVQQVLKKNTQITPEFIQSLVDDFATLYTAGTDTTSHAAQMAIYHTYTTKGVSQKLSEEIKVNIHTNQLHYDSFKNCNYLEALITETLRVYSTTNGIFPREAGQDHFITVGEGVKIPIKKGTLVNTQTITTQHKESIFTNALKFEPERFLDKEGKLINPEPFSIMNFSAGVRSCIGKRLALTQLRVIMSTLAAGYEVKIEDADKRLIFKQFAANFENVKFSIRPKKT